MWLSVRCKGRTQQPQVPRGARYLRVRRMQVSFKTSTLIQCWRVNGVCHSDISDCCCLMTHYKWNVNLPLCVAGVMRGVLDVFVSVAKTKSGQRTWMPTAAKTMAPTSAATMVTVCAAPVNVRRGRTLQRSTAANTASVTTSTVTAPTTSSVEVRVQISCWRCGSEACGETGCYICFTRKWPLWMQEVHL